MLSDLVVDGSIVAIESGDREDSFYLLRCTRPVTVLEADTSIGGVLEAAGTKVVHGQWFNRVSRRGEYCYQLLDTETVCSANSIRYLCPTSCFQVTVKGRKTLFKLEDHVVESILDSLVI